MTSGYNNWKAATDALRKHESNDCLVQSVEKLNILPSTKDIGETLATLGKVSESAVFFFFFERFFSFLCFVLSMHTERTANYT